MSLLKFNLISLDGPKQFSYKEVQYEKEKLPDNFVIVKVDYAALGPYDTGILSYHIPISHPKDFPTTFGFEGVGIITDVGNKIDKDIISKNCSFMCSMYDDTQIRAYSEYVIIPYNQIFIHKDKENYKNNAYLYGNPFTARGFLEEILLKGKYESIVIDTAASALGKMILKLCSRHGIKVITITRSQTSIEAIENISQNFINLNQTDKEFTNKMKEAFKLNNPSLYITFQGGNLPSRVFDALPNKAKLVSLGNIQREDMDGFSTHPIIFQGKEMFGYTVFPYFNKLLSEGNFEKIAAEILNDEAYKTELTNDSVEFSFKEFAEGLDYYTKNSSKGKILFKP